VSLVAQAFGSAVILAAFTASQSWLANSASRLYLAANVIGSLALGASAWLGSQ
jgi:hypothetical protein